MADYSLSKEEQEVLNSIEKGQWREVKNMSGQIERYAKYAKETLKKTQRISIRMSKQDFLGIQAKAINEGLPYQTLIASIIHKYIAGKLTPKT